jgi:hypothetical protein
LNELWKRHSSGWIVADLDELHTHRVGVVVIVLDACGDLDEHLGEFEFWRIVCCSLIRGELGRDGKAFLRTRVTVGNDDDIERLNLAIRICVLGSLKLAHVIVENFLDSSTRGVLPTSQISLWHNRS